MQSYDMPLEPGEKLAELQRLARLDRINGDHLEPLRTGIRQHQSYKRIQEFFAATSDKAILDRMDERKAELEALGAVNFHRTKIGRNTTCPCGSKLKFKKCCMDKVEMLG